LTPPRLTTPARRLLRSLKKWDAERHGIPVICAETVPAAAELLRKGLIALNDYKGSIEVTLRLPPQLPSRTCEEP
jgi:hypothetical protein